MKKILFVVSCAMLLAVGANAALITNGDFETGPNWRSDRVGPSPTGWYSPMCEADPPINGHYGEQINNLSSRPALMKSTETADNYYQQVLSGVDAGTSGSYTVGFDYGVRHHSSYATQPGDSYTLRVSLWDTTADTELAGKDVEILYPDGGGSDNNFLTSTSEALTYDNSGLAGNELALRFTNTTAAPSNIAHKTIMFDNVVIEAKNVAILVSPELDSVEPIDVNTTLQWSAPEDITPASYNLSIRIGDPNFTDTGSTTVITNVTSPYKPSVPLLSETTYYWRVDTVESGTGTVYSGMTWYFTTAPAIPYVLTDPISQIVPAGTNVTLTVDAINVDSYQWYQDDDMVPDATAATLEITGTELADEGYYLCRLTNTEGSTDSASARVLIYRMYNNWQFNDNMLDSVSDNDGQGWGSDPNYAPGNDGSSSAVFYGDNAVQVPNDPEMHFDAFTVSFWAKVDGNVGSYRAAISNRNGTPQRGFIIYAKNNDVWSFWTGSGSAWNQIGSEPVVIGEWIHVVGSLDSNGVKKLYINGVKTNEAEVIYAKNIEHGLLIGAGANESPANYYFNGQIDDVQLYNYAIDPIDIALLYTDVQGGDVCYEFPEFDLNEDCYVDLSDFAIMASQWLECNLIPASNCP